MIQFENVGLRYGGGPEILKDVNLELKKGSFHFLTGPSGAGKTSLLRLLYLGRKPTRGLIRMFGQDINVQDRDDLALLRRRIGVVFQDFRLLPHLSAYDNVALPLRLADMPEKEIRNNVIELLEWVGLGDYLHSTPPTLSGGQQQRIAIARAVINRPDLLLADEPTGNLDDSIGLKLMHLFDELNKLGTTIVIASHNEVLMNRFKHEKLHLVAGTVQKDAA